MANKLKELKMPNLYTKDTRSMLEGYLYGKVPLEREKPTFGQSKRYFVDPNDENKRIDVPDGTDP